MTIQSPVLDDQLSVAEQPESKPLSKAQKAFNQFIKKLQQERKRLDAWQAVVLQYQAQRAKEVEPLNQAYAQQRAALATLLDEAYSQPDFTKSEKRKLANHIQTLASELIFTEGRDELKAMYNKYSCDGYDEELAEEKRQMNRMLADMLGAELDEDTDAHSMEEIFLAIGKKINDEMEQKAFFANKLRQPLKQSAKALAKEAKAQKEAQETNQSIRAIFRALVSTLHPDREQDAVERERKNALMQRANAAYKKKDLLTLLELQYEVGHGDKALNSMAENPLVHYNKLLKNQLIELKRETEIVITKFIMQNNLDFDLVLSPQDAMFLLQQEIKHLHCALADIEKDLIRFQQVKNIKAWLKKN